jgi:MFS family permease
MIPGMRRADSFYGWINLLVLFFFNIALMLMLLSFALFLPSWVEEFAWSRGDISWAQTLNMILSGLAAPIVGVFIMKNGAKRALLIGNTLSLLGLVMLAYQTHIWQLFLGYGIMVGLGLSIGGMLAMMTVINNWFIVKRPAALAVSMAAMGFGGVVFNPVLMTLIDTIIACGYGSGVFLHHLCETTCTSIAWSRSNLMEIYFLKSLDVFIIPVKIY